MTEDLIPSLIWLAGIACAVGALYVFLQAHLHTLFSRTSPRANQTNVLVIGLRNSGKTTLWQTLKDSLGVVSETIPSQHPASGSFDPCSPSASSGEKNDPLSREERLQLFGSIQVLDTPGSWCSNPGLLKEYLRHTSCILFCVDATCQSEVKEAATYLFDVLRLPEFQQRLPAFALIINKLDEEKARHRIVIREDIEREIERASRFAMENVEAADIPLSAPTTVVGRFLFPARKLLHQIRKARQQPAGKLRLTTHGNLFRLANLRCTQFTLIQEDSCKQNAEMARAFIRRVFPITK